MLGVSGTQVLTRPTALLGHADDDVLQAVVLHEQTDG
jgi:hypothetical protein